MSVASNRVLTHDARQPRQPLGDDSLYVVWSTARREHFLTVVWKNLNITS